MYVIKNELDKNFTDFLVKKVRTGSGTLFQIRPSRLAPDPQH
jgi:hypothetical protein